MATSNTSINSSKKSQPTQHGINNLYAYISEYEKHRRYYFRDYDDRYQIDSCNEQQFERIFGNSTRSFA